MVGPQVPRCDIFILVGEPSGDAYAASIITALQERFPHLVIAGAGSHAMRATGIDVDVAMDDYAVMGLLAVLRRLGEFRRLGTQVREAIRARSPRLLLTIDYPGFNLRMHAAVRGLRSQGMVSCHMVAPQVWAWKPRRAKKVAALVDRLLCFFPFEPPLFERHGGDAQFIGHPLLDAIPDPSQVIRDESTDTWWYEQYHLRPQDRVLLLAPGSREHEVSRLLPVFDEVWSLIGHRLGAPEGGRVVPIIAKSPHLDHSLYRRFTHHQLIEGSYRHLLRRAHAGLIASGTATLEAALAGVPHIIAYRGDYLTARVVRYLIRTQHVGLPNIVANHRIVPELLQDQCEPVRMAAHLERLWDGAHRQQCCQDLADVRRRLGSPGALLRAVDALIDICPDLSMPRGASTDGAPSGPNRADSWA